MAQSDFRTGKYAPTDRDIEELILAASRHPLGLDFLREGQLCAVAVTFQVHAFTVEAARARLDERGVART